MNSTAVAEPGAPPPFWRRAFDWSFEEFKKMLVPTIFFFAGFHLVLWTKAMILEEHGIPFTNFVAATVGALIVGKTVLIVDNLPLMRRFDGAPLIQPILFKSSIYWLCVLIVRLAEGLISFLVDGGALAAFPAHLAGQFNWPRFISIQLWVMVLFLIYVTLHELNTLFGDGELYRLFFRWHSSEAKLTRRQRIRLLTRLNRLTEANSVETISERGTPAHRELVGILRTLSSRPIGARARA